MKGDIVLKINKKVGLLMLAVAGLAAMADYVSIVDIQSSGGVSIITPEEKVAPVGTVAMWTTATPPDGWIEMNGQSTSAYPKLSAIVGSNVPDLRGEFVRGWDNGRGVDQNRSLNSAQLDQIQNITGKLSSLPSANESPIEEENANLKVEGAFGLEPNITYVAGGGGGSANTGTSGFNFDSSRIVRAGDETRGRNIALMYIIKAE